ncbi:hypothetical protein [Halopseudomonas salegens]|nr:hypothetical protein [Halopseudomonas salegens]
MQWLTPPLVILGIGLVLFFIAARFRALPQVEAVGTGFGVAAWCFVIAGLIWTIVRLVKASPGN